MKDLQKPAKTTPSTGKTTKAFTDEERAAMKERAREVKAATNRGSRAAKEDGERDVLAKIAAMSGPDRTMAERLHALIKANAPALSPRLWYGMPAYARDGKVVCFFQSAQKFKTRYATLGFSDEANLDDGAVWPVAFALKRLTAEEEATISALVKKAASRGATTASLAVRIDVGEVQRLRTPCFESISSHGSTPPEKMLPRATTRSPPGQ